MLYEHKFYTLIISCIVVSLLLLPLIIEDAEWWYYKCLAMGKRVVKGDRGLSGSINMCPLNFGGVEFPHYRVIRHSSCLAFLFIHHSSLSLGITRVWGIILKTVLLLINIELINVSIDFSWSLGRIIPRITIH